MNPSAGGPYRARAPGGLASGPNSPLPGTPSAPGGVGPGVAERIVWSYIVQIGSVVKAVHNSGLAVRTLEPNRVLVTGKHRVRLAGCAVLDVLQWDGGAQIAGHQVSWVYAWSDLGFSPLRADTRAPVALLH